MDKIDLLQDIITVAVVNFKTAAANKASNLNRICGYVEAAGKRGADLVLFPEMCLMGYDYYIDESVSRKDKILSAETFDGESASKIAKIAKKYDIYVVYGMAEISQSDKEKFARGEIEDCDLFNSAIVIGGEGIIGSYKKIHPFEDENSWCKKGDTPFMFDTKWGAISVGICYDTYQFPELMRHYISKGSRLYLNPTAVIEDYQKNGSREAFLRFYAPTLEYGVLCNTIFIASSNLTGYDDFSYFGGGSCVIGPNVSAFYDTDVHYYAGDKDNVQEELLMSTIDLSLAKRMLCQENKYAKEPDYRPELYKKFLNT